MLAPAAKCRNAQLSGAHGRSGCSSKRLSAFFARCTHQDRCAPARNDVQRYADYSVGRVVIDRAGRQSCHFVDQFVAGVVAQHVPRVCLREAFHEFPLRADEEVVRAHPGDFFAQPVYQGAAQAIQRTGLFVLVAHTHALPFPPEATCAVHTGGVTRSIPVAPTIKSPRRSFRSLTVKPAMALAIEERLQGAEMQPAVHCTVQHLRSSFFRSTKPRVLRTSLAESHPRRAWSTP